MAMSPGVRRFVLVAHLSFSVGWIGAVLAYLGLGVAAQTSTDALTVRAAWIGMELVGWYVLVPLAVTSLVTGVVMALGTRWGLFRHYWVVFSFALTVFATAVLLLHMPTVSSTAEVAREADSTRLVALGGDLVHPGIGLVVLLVVLVLNLYKPRGLTGYGRRRVDERRAQPVVDS
ncbi:MAG: DUF2269 domain-containing protein [Acidimicrobiia bacterium]